MGLDRTIEILTATPNLAADDVLLRALDSAHRAIQERTLRALLERGSQAGQREIVRRWHTFDERLKTVVAQRPARIHDALRDAILGRDTSPGGNACDAVLWTKEYDLLPALLTTAEELTHPLSITAARTLLALADVLHDELAAPRDYSNRRDPQLVRAHMLGGLETSLTRFARHQRVEILDAFLQLTTRENAALKRILLDGHDRCHRPMMELLTTSSRPVLMGLLLAFLEDPHAPLAALQALAARTDEPFLRHLLKKLAGEQSPVVKANLKRIELFPWLREDHRRLLALAEHEQPGVVFLAMNSGLKRPQAFEIVHFLLRSGNVAGRRAAALALAEFPTLEGNQAALAALDDPDPQVQVHILLQLRERGIPGAITRLLELVESSPHLVVRQAVQQCLAEFSFNRYLAAFDMLTPEVRRTTGQLVRKIDPETIPQLTTELTAAGLTRKRRALEIVACSGMAPDLEPQLIALLNDEEPLVRLEAALLLADCDTPSTRQALRLAMVDRHTSVQEAAEKSLRTLTQNLSVKTSPPEPVR